MNTVAFSTSTPVQPTTRDRNRLAIARVAAGGRIQAERAAEQAKRQAWLDQQAAREAELVAQVKALGGAAVNIKVCFHDGGKLRLGDVDPVSAAHWIMFHRRAADDVEACVIGADGEPLLDQDGYPVYL